jgi:hypothetical protein
MNTHTCHFSPNRTSPDYDHALGFRDFALHCDKLLLKFCLCSSIFWAHRERLPRSSSQDGPLADRQKWPTHEQRLRLTKKGNSVEPSNGCSSTTLPFFSSTTLLGVKMACWESLGSVLAAVRGTVTRFSHPGTTAARSVAMGH